MREECGKSGRNVAAEVPPGKLTSNNNVMTNNNNNDNYKKSKKKNRVSCAPANIVGRIGRE